MTDADKNTQPVEPENQPTEAEIELENVVQEQAASAEFEALKSQAAELKDQLLRTMAEMENVKKRAERDIKETSKYAVSGIAKDLVNVCENLHRALESVPEDQLEGNELLKNLKVGVDMTLSELLSVFSRHGITRLFPLGQKFDHNFHQAVVQIDDQTVEPGTVVQVLQAGYVINDRLLRPALVGVAKGQAQTKVDTAA